MKAVAALYETFKDVLVIAEVRVVAADDLWLSPMYKRASAALHFTWTADEAAVRAITRIPQCLQHLSHIVCKSAYM
jgi:xylitol oxidase